MPSARASKAEESEVYAEPVIERAPAPDFTPSAYQERIFNWFGADRNPCDSQNLVVVARAGSGKTTTILKAIDYAPEQRILLTAFNKPIQEELAARLTNSNAEASTLHSLGYRYIRRKMGYIRLCKKNDRAEWLAAQVSGGLGYGAQRLVALLVTKAREIEPTDATVDSLIELALDFDIVPEPGDNYGVDDIARATMRALGVALDRKGIRETGIDFSDMIFLPLAMELLERDFDMVVVDEAQDMSKSQLDLAQGVCTEGGRIVVVGDDRQAIYGFRGADAKSLARLKSELHAQELRLPRTYRCGLSIVAEAQRLVPDIEPNPHAGHGLVDSLDSMSDLIERAGPGDFILSRKNAPIAKVAMRLLRANKPAMIRGRAIGDSLKAMVRQLGKGLAANSMIALGVRLDAYEEKQTAQLLRLKKEERIELLHDKCETLRYLMENAGDISNLLARLDYLFTDDPTTSVLCSTVHKAKGLEADRVFILDRSFIVNLPCECGHRHPRGNQPCKRCECEHYTASESRRLEEENIMYVAITRAKKHLTRVRADV
jgi:superfamily I DNA/RNA helicase